MILTYIMIFLALIHFYWALGGEFGLDYALPTDDKGNRLLNPGKMMTFSVGFLLIVFAYVSYRLYSGDGSAMMVYAGYGLSILFSFRLLEILTWWDYLKKSKIQHLPSMIHGCMYHCVCLSLSIFFFW